MVRLYALVFLAQTVLAVCAAISCLSAEPDRVRALPRAAWLPVILLFPLVGSIAWFLAGRPPPDRPGGTRRWLGSPRPVGPDDDPDFLGSLRPDRSARQRELFDRWEEDLRHRDDDRAPDPPRRRDTDGTPQGDTRPEG
jgi:hypothetical protein